MARRRHWDESKHPRDRAGRFADHPGGGWLSKINDRMPAPAATTQKTQAVRVKLIETGDIIRWGPPGRPSSSQKEYLVTGFHKGPDRTSLRVEGLDDGKATEIELHTHESITVVGQRPKGSRRAPAWSLSEGDTFQRDGQWWTVRDSRRKSNGTIDFTAANDRRQQQTVTLGRDQYVFVQGRDRLAHHKVSPAGDDSKWLHQRRKDALKPGRKVVKPPQYASQRDYRIAQEQAKLAAAERDLESVKQGSITYAARKARERGEYVPAEGSEYFPDWVMNMFHPDKETPRQLRDYIDYLRESGDPALDRQAQVGGDPVYGIAQRPDPKRPLAVYGDMLHLGGGKNVFDATRGMETIPVDFHTVVADHMARKDKGGVWFGSRSVADMDHSHDLKDVSPRGWGEEKTFDDVNGVYRGNERTLIVGLTENTLFNETPNVARHEFGHALDNALGSISGERGGWISHGSEWTELHNKVKAEGRVSGKLSPYFQQEGYAGQQEFWAEAFHVWAANRDPSGRDPDTHHGFIQEFGVGGATARELVKYFDAVQIRVQQLAREVTDRAFGAET